ncbi:trihelix transcription factor GTL1 isoform X2 [Magnolia sinica]|uniref:trihelix transcription factor GTL1 isoform X2 n=1 Tax=Magnolia sinica TaxID=86752 RepID=UPI0026584669|nr:trihelix transcription factor GTL1 isoform X2 [Magnolia sinica]
MQQQQQQGGPQYGVPPEMPPPFTGTGGSRAHTIGIPGSDAAALAEAASPISSRPPPPPARGNFEEMAPGPSGFQDDDVGEEAERGPPGNRWPRQETLALLKIRSDMDAAFRDATLKGPLWEDVSRKLAELGYTRSAKKCKEKFENVHKYYKRTKEGRAGRQDGKSYRFFSQLEALHSNISSTTTTIMTVVAPPAVNPPAVPIPVGVGTSNPMVGSSGRLAPPTPTPVSAAPAASTPQINVIPPIGPDLTGPAISGPGSGAAAAGISFSTSSSESESDDEIEEGGSKDTRKRKRSGSSGGGSRKMMAFFEGLMKQVMEKQEAMQLRFLETIEKREQDRMMREDAWKRQEMARLAREQEIMAQERAMSASRDAAVITFLQKITGQTVPIPSPAIIIPAAPPPLQPTPPPPPQPPPPPPPQQQPQHRHQQQPLQQPQSTEIVQHQPSLTEVAVVLQEPPQHSEGSGGGSFDPTSSRWPKTEVLALINLRSGLDSRYQETGPKGPLWEEISGGMQRLGYNRSAKRCKEKWENINKYFKKVKESNKKRPEDAKTCPYFHQLDALYRKKGLGSSSFSNQNKQEQDTDTNPNRNLQEKTDVLAIMPPPPPPPPQQQQHSEIKGGSSNKNGGNPDAGGGSVQVQTSNGGLPPSFFEGAAKKKAL